jgi:hypothetical protein
LRGALTQRFLAWGAGFQVSALFRTGSADAIKRMPQILDPVIANWSGSGL